MRETGSWRFICVKRKQITARTNLSQDVLITSKHNNGYDKSVCKNEAHSNRAQVKLFRSEMSEKVRTVARNAMRTR
jgi:hypothetical protein